MTACRRAASSQSSVICTDLPGGTAVTDAERISPAVSPRRGCLPEKANMAAAAIAQASRAMKRIVFFLCFPPDTGPVFADIDAKTPRLFPGRALLLSPARRIGGGNPSFAPAGNGRQTQNRPPGEESPADGLFLSAIT